MKVSVIIPFYDLERYARACLDSVLAAVKGREDRVEVICVDDGSTDSTPRILDEYASRYPFVKAVHKPNGGEGSARNAGLAAASGEWVTFADGDDRWSDDYLEVAESAIARHPGAEVFGFALESFGDGTEPGRHIGRAGASEREFDVSASVPSDVVVRLGLTPAFFRRSVVAGLSFSPLPLGADRLFVSECLLTARRIVISDAVIYDYRTRAGSTSNVSWDARKIRSMIDCVDGVFRNFTASGRRLERGGAVYLAHALLGWAAKYTSRLADGGEREEVSRRLAEAVRAMDPRRLPVFWRLRRRMYLMSHSKPRIEDR